jgi:beta-galactosidase
MKIRQFHFVVFISVLQISLNAQVLKRDSLFDSDWKFFRGKTEGADKPGFDDKAWRNIDLPHDWSIEDLPLTDKSQSSTGKPHIISGPFDSEALCGSASGYTIGGTGWYRKHFKLPKDLADKVVTIQFDGVYMNSDVWINGHHLGNHPYGYTAFGYDLSKYLNYGDDENVISVEVKNEGRNSRWYSGSGIYRHVNIEITNKIHTAHWGTYITTTEADPLNAKVDVKTTVNNYTSKNADISLICSVFNSKSEKVSEKKIFTQVFKNLPSVINLSFDIPKPDLWSPDSPVFYKAICEIMNEDQIVDKTETQFAIRTLRFDTEKGFFLNGKHLKLKGGSLHSNNGPLGAVANDRSEIRRVELLKSAGFNAIRCGHNPPSSAFLDACDRLGMLVLDEFADVWVTGWLDDDYHVYFNDWWKKDVSSMVLRDRNHPSIFAWSIGNQIRENKDSIGIALTYEISELVRSLDPSRPVAANIATNGHNWRDCPSDEWRKCDPIFAALDICGYSYQASQYENDHQRLPDRIMFSTEIDPIHSFDNWMKALDHDYVLGNFEWTAMDFMGEVSLGWWGFSKSKDQLYPWMSTYSGDFDLCGFKRPRSYYRDVLFNTGNKLSVFVFAPVHSFEGTGDSPWGWDDVKPSWTWPEYEGKTLPVVAYSVCDSVQLILNNKPLETKITSRKTEFKATWQVPYEPGTLKAIGYLNGQKTAEWKLITAGEPSKIHLTADQQVLKADGQDLSYVTVEITDKNGIINPQFNDLINFSVEGEGTIAAVGNSNPISMESFQQPYRKAYEGRCLVIIRSNKTAGQIILHASGKGLTSDRIVINTNSIITERP